MKKNLITVTSVLLAFLLTGCSSKQEESQTPVTENILSSSETEEISDTDYENINISPVYETYEDYFGKLDEDTAKQISLIADKLPELKGEHHYIFLTDLDGNGRTELILSDPDFIIYEISENRDSLVQTAALANDFPVLYPVSNRLIFTDSAGTRHYIWRSVLEESSSSVRQSDKEYIYENGQLSVRKLRSSIYDRYSGSYTSYMNADDAPDLPAYSKALASLYFYSYNTPQQLSMGVLTSDDIENADAETLKQFLAELRGYFAVTPPKEKYMYTDLNGTWTRSGGVSSGTDYFHETEDSTVKLVFHDDVYELSGNDALTVPSAAAPVSFNMGGERSTAVWYVSLTDNGVLKNASASIDNNGVLHLEGQIVYQNNQEVNIEWSFHKEGWDYPDSTPVYESETPVQNNNPVSSAEAPAFSAEALAEKALAYYERTNYYRPGSSSVTATESEGIFSVHLFDKFDDYVSTCARYTIDSATMTGTDDITGEFINLNE